jgi:hypothetical protein
VIVAVIVAAGVIGGGGGSGAQGARPAASPASIPVARIERRVERLRGLRFERPLHVTFAPPAKARKIYDTATRSERLRRRELIDEEEMKLLGLLEPGQDLHRYLDAIGSEQVLGFYDDHSKRLVVVTGRSGSRSLQEITLAHELVHALEDQHFHVRSRGTPSDDRASAETALAEGTATALMVDYADHYMGLGAALDAFAGLGGDKTKLPPFIEDLLLFPYEQGATFVNTFRGANGGWRAIDKIIRFRRPRSTEQVIHPDKYVRGEAPAAVPAARVGPLLRGWTKLDRTGIGELDLRLLFEHVGGTKDRAAAAGWGGGALELWRKRGRGPCPAPCVARDAAVMTLVWDTPLDREQGEAALRSVFEHGLSGKRLALGQGTGLWSSRGGAIAMRAGGRRTDVAFAPAPSLAAKLLAPRRT